MKTEITVGIEEREHRIEDGLRTAWFGNEDVEVLISLHTTNLLITYKGRGFVFDAGQVIQKLHEKIQNEEHEDTPEVPEESPGDRDDRPGTADKTPTGS